MRIEHIIRETNVRDRRKGGKSMKAEKDKRRVARDSDDDDDDDVK
jgi:hypothetical protein